MLTAALANAKDLEVVWRTDFAGEIAGGLVVADDKVTAVSNQGDVYQLTAEGVAAGMALPQARSSLIQNLQFNDIAQFDGALAAVGPIGEAAITRSAAGDNKVTRREADMAFFDGENFPNCNHSRFGYQLVTANRYWRRQTGDRYGRISGRTEQAVYSVGC